ncbi:F-box/kelch-repeat protein-like [Dorcoceras hygrometricum]|uniref:F-box/kelch-repeat protein-like n=1 Tax=Dorcoceras hygrometricum TaxID=472368 RepID=A0A2Z7CSI7_9LAMI|nr:F-box/kelch-repeat protein-like [Dorcoceras hygrometricum]
MASSFYSNSQHIDFDSVLAMDDPVATGKSADEFYRRTSLVNGLIFSRWSILKISAGGRIQQISHWFVFSREHCDVLSMQIDSDLVIYRTTLVRTFQVVTICRVDKYEVLVVLISPHD